MREHHKRLKDVFPSTGIARGDYEALIMLALDAYPGVALRVADFLAVAKIVDFQADKKQVAHVAKQMADDGKLFVTTYEGNYYYLPGLDDESQIPF